MAQRNRRANWLARPPSTKQGDPWYAFRSVSFRWVTENPNSRENIARAVLEKLFSKPFPKARPTFLRNPQTNRCLELDAWNPELNIAVEFNGIQHSQFPNPFHSTYAQFEIQCKRDTLKARLCKGHNVKLILIPHTVHRDEIELFLQDHLQHEINTFAGGAQPTHLAADAPCTAISVEADVLSSFARIKINS